MDSEDNVIGFTGTVAFILGYGLLQWDKSKDWAMILLLFIYGSVVLSYNSIIKHNYNPVIVFIGFGLLCLLTLGNKYWKVTKKDNTLEVNGVTNYQSI